MAKMTLDGLTAQLTQAFGDALTAVVLYGSAARSERVESRSDHNVLVVVRALTPAALRAAAAAASAWGDAGNLPPLVMTEAEWRSSRDVFAMEHADIEARHQLLWGALPAPAGPVDATHLRHQLEFEALGKLLAFRQGILACAGDSKRELELLTASRSAVLVLLRTLLRVHGEPATDSAEEVVRRAAALAGFDPAPFLDVIGHARGTTPIAKARADAVLEAYHAGLKRLVAHVDALVHPGRGPMD
ncbi:MAG: hypothetical protein WD771_02405 [Gemmatimonadaceae bacterium]